MNDNFLDFKYKIENASDGFIDIKFAINKIKRSLKYLSSNNNDSFKNHISTYNIDLGICYILNIISKGIRDNNIPELTVIYYMINLSGIDNYNINSRFFKYFKKIIKICLILTKKSNTNYNENIWYKIIERYYFTMLYWLYTDYPNIHSDGVLKELIKVI